MSTEETMAISKEQLMYVYKILHGGDFNKNGKINFTKLYMHGQKFLNAILTEMKTH